MAETSWKTCGASSFGFFGDADEAIVDWLQNDAPSTHTTYFTNVVKTWKSHVVALNGVPLFDFSKSKFPLVFVSSGGQGYTTDFIETGVSTLIRVRTEILVFTEGSQQDVRAQQCREVAGAIASALHQTHNGTESGEWPTFFQNHDDPVITAEALQFVPSGEGAPYYRVRLLVDWAHHDN